MLNRTKMVLELLVHHKKLLINDMNVAACCFCYTIHEMITELELRKRCDKDYEKFKEEIYNFIDGFVQLYKI